MRVLTKNLRKVTVPPVVPIKELQNKKKPKKKKKNEKKSGRVPLKPSISGKKRLECG